MCPIKLADWPKHIKTAWKRMTKIGQNANTDTQQKLINAEAFLCRLKQFSEESSADSIISLIHEFYDNARSRLEKQHKKVLQDSEIFADIQQMPKAEKDIHLDETRKKIERDHKAFEAQYEFNLKLFNLKTDEKSKTITLSEEITEVITALENHYLVYPIDRLKIIDAIKSGIDIEAKRYLTGDDAYDIVTNGTFFNWTGNEMIVYGTLLLHKKKPVETKETKVKRRGGLAVLESGLVVIKQAPGNAAKEVLNHFSEPAKPETIAIPEVFEKDPVAEYLGGGALLIQNSKLVSGTDLFNVQRFDNMDAKHADSTDGFDARQMYATQHVVFGIRDEQPYLIVPWNKTSKRGKDIRTIQKDLADAGFSDVIKFDGGGEFYLNGKDLKIAKGKNSPTGFAVKTIKFGR